MSEINNLCQLLENNTYPGRGIVLGNTKNNEHVALYFIMGRSTNSRNRIFIEEADGIRTEAYKKEDLEDPSLIIYHPVRESEKGLIVTNGDQTDTILEAFLNNETFYDALMTREFEPDKPNYTPRISGLLKDDGSYSLSILKTINDGKNCQRNFYCYEKALGKGHFIHTYEKDGNPIPTFNREPEEVLIEDDIDTFANKVWNALNPDNKISLFVRYIDSDNYYRQLIFNKHLEEK